ncbi:MAG TPA: hypothetical protein DIU39_03335 [Flavobacteriales bacterium]|nr:hypothetical protein [Flavobacteriales bacterium]|tara:strand:+ start:22817 stop:24130 length:1314 start_codon:yes stop_codon:yes gene_type:complete
MKSFERMKNLTKRKVMLSALFFLILLGGCKKKGNIVPAFDNPPVGLNYTDTISLKLETLTDDSVLSSIAAYNLLGKYNDPVFGITQAGFYTQVRLTGNSVDFGTNVVLDSVILALDYQSLYGSETDPLNIKVYEISDDLYPDSSYYSNHYLNILSEIASYTFVPAINDSVSVGGEKTTPHLRIPLSSAFGQKLLNAGGTTDLENNDNFLEFMKGLYVAMDSSQTFAQGTGSIVSFDLLSAVSGLTIYYTNTDSAQQYQYTFVVNSECAKYNVFNHDYTGTEVEQAFNQTEIFDTAYNYLQGAAGLQVKINFPYIESLKNQNLLINKVELVIPVENNKIGNYPVPDNITVSKLNENGELEFLPDFLEGVTYFGGNYDEINQEYVLNISRHVQELINGKENDYGLLVKVSGASIYPNRVVLGAPNNPNKKVTLRVYYTK